MSKSFIQVIKQLDAYTESISRISSPDALSKSVEKILENIFDLQITCLYLYDSLQECLTLYYTKGLSEAELLLAGQPTMESGPEMVFRSGNMVHIPDIRAEHADYSLPFHLSFETGSLLYLPLINGDKAVGVLGIADSKPGAYTEEDIAVLTIICNMTGSAYGNFLDQEQLKKESEKALSFSQIPSENPDPVLRISNGNEIVADIVNYSESNKKYRTKLHKEPVLGETGQSENFISIQKDVTEEKATELNFIESFALQKAILNSSDIAIITTNLDGVIQSFNPAASRMLGYKEEEAVGLLTPYHFHDETEIRTRAHVNPDSDIQKLRLFKIEETSEPDSANLETGEFTFIRKDRSKFPVSLIVTALRDEYNHIKGFLAMATDITHLRLERQNLEKSEERFRQIVEQSQDVIWEVDSEGLYTYVSPLSMHVYGRTPEEITGRLHFYDLHPEEKREQVKKAAFMVFSQRKNFKNLLGYIIKPDGNEAIVETNGIPIIDENDVLIGYRGIDSDITERVKTEKEREKNEAIYRLITEKSNDLIYAYRYKPSMGFEYVSPSAQIITGYAPEEFYNDPLLEQKIVHPDDRNLMESMENGSIDRGSKNLRWIKKDGSIIWVEIQHIPVYNEKDELTGFHAKASDISDRMLKEFILNSSIRLSDFSLTHSLEELYLQLLAEIESVTGCQLSFIYIFDEKQEKQNSQIWSARSSENIPGSMDRLPLNSIGDNGILAECVADQKPVIHNNCIVPPAQYGLPEGHTPVSSELAVPIFRNNRLTAAVVLGNKPSVFTEHDIQLVKELSEITWDIAELKIAEQELHKVSHAVEHSPVMTYITDLTGIIEYANPKVYQITGYTREEVVGKNPRIFSSGEKPKKEYQELWDTISSGKGWKGEFHNRKKNGELYWVSASLSPVLDITGKISHYIAIEEDITQRKQQYDALQLSNLRFNLLISKMQAGVMLENIERIVELVNQNFCDLFSIPVAPELLTGADCGEAAEQVKALFSNPDTFIRDINETIKIGQIVTNFELQMADGRVLERDYIPIESMGDHNKGILWIYRDITKRKQNETELLRQSRVLVGTTQATKYLLTVANHDLAIQNALHALGIATGSDRVYIFENNENIIIGEAVFSQRYEWTAKGTTSQISNNQLQNISYSRQLPRWYKRLMSGKTVSGFLNDFPPNERLFLENQDIISIIHFPIFVNNRLWGFMGYDDCTKGTVWSSNETSILTVFTSSLGGAIEKEQIGKELMTARQIAENATQSKSNFLATMSHEIRTPMNGVIGMTSLLMQTELNLPQREYAETIKVSGELLLDLINEILDFAKIESGKMTLEETNFDLRLAIEDVFDLVGTATQKKKIELFYDIDPAIPQKIKGDLTRIRQILVNLIGNALKFTTEGEIAISVRQIDKRGDEIILEFSVRDTGIGIPNDRIDLLFKPFNQLDASTTRKYGGSGLGLAICAEIVKLMQGEIWVESEENCGSEFFFTIKTFAGSDKKQPVLNEQELIKGKKILVAHKNETGRKYINAFLKTLGMEPVCVASGKMALYELKGQNKFDLMIIDSELQDMKYTELAAEIKKVDAYAKLPLILLEFPESNVAENDSYFNMRLNKPIKKSLLLLHLQKLLAGNHPSTLQSPYKPLQIEMINERYPLQILVAEDNKVNQKLILRLFEMLGYTIHLVANGYEVIETLHRIQVDIIFMDIQMPEMDGLEATRQIILQWGENRPLIVAMTANALIGDKENCLAAGMDDYISKPLTINQVSSSMEKWALSCKLRKNNTV